jgi:hypothetical protein
MLDLVAVNLVIKMDSIKRIVLITLQIISNLIPVRFNQAMMTTQGGLILDKVQKSQINDFSTDNSFQKLLQIKPRTKQFQNISAVIQVYIK